MCFLVVKVKNMLGVFLAGQWEELGEEVVQNEDRCLYIIKASIYSVLLVRKVDPYYGKYKGISLIDGRGQLKR
jgi:hypothetical protein